MKSIVTGFLAIAVLVASAIGSSAASVYLQASSTEDQLATDAKPKVITMNSTDAAKGMENKNGAVIIGEDGAYFVVAAIQVGGKVKGTVRLWLRQNGKDVDNSNCEQVIPDPAFTTVMVSQGIVEAKKGDKIEAAYSGSVPGIGLIVKKPSGEPVVPSIIFSAFKLN